MSSDLGAELARIREESLAAQSRARQAAELAGKKADRSKTLDPARVQQRTMRALGNVETRLKRAAETSDKLEVMKLTPDDFLNPDSYELFTRGSQAGYPLEHLVGVAEKVVKYFAKIAVNLKVETASYTEDEGQPLDEHEVYYPVLNAIWR